MTIRIRWIWQHAWASKKDLSEADICDRFITPAIEGAGWERHQWRREYFTDGRIIVRGKLPVGFLDFLPIVRSPRSANALRN